MTSRSSSLLALSFSALALVAPRTAAGQSTTVGTTIQVHPDLPSPGDDITLRLVGTWPSGCVPGSVVKPTVSKDPARITISLNYAAYTGACTAVLTDYRLDVPIGKLAAGTYEVDVTVLETLFPPRTLATRRFTVGPRPELTLYVPGVFASGRKSADMLGCDGTLTLASGLSAYNNGAGVASFSVAAAYDENGSRILAEHPIQLRPGAGTQLDTKPESSRLQILALRATEGVVVWPTLTRNVACDRGSVPSQGRVPLPTFTSLFPADAHAVSGDVKILDSPSDACPTFNPSFAPTFRRRVNLTLFNAGNAAATFRVVGRQLAQAGAPAVDLVTERYSVPARTVRQIDNLKLELAPLCAADGPDGLNIWFDVSADQPFLSYVSTAFEDATPGALPYEIYPSRLEQ